jgi:4-alpha-glucanotransferase
MKKTLERGAGILLPISALPSPYGIGTLGKNAYAFADALKSANQKYWQVLPVGPTSYGDSPYQSFSAFAGNPYFIDLDELVSEGLLREKELTCVNWADKSDEINYETQWNNRYKVLRKAYKRSNIKEDPDFLCFCNEKSEWLDDYALFMACKKHFKNNSWLEWPDKSIKFKEKKGVEKYTKLLAEEITFQKYLQYLFFDQWSRLKAYVNNLGISIIGDIPIYVALDSSDVWSSRKLFQLRDDGSPTDVAGVPPDAFSSWGQKWGNPLYDWDKMKLDDFSWWRKRIASCTLFYDIIRFDHFIGCVRYFSIPAGGEPKNGKYNKGPGIALIKAIDQSLGKSRLIAEDLGVIVPDVRSLLKKSGYPGMKVLEFAFDSGSSNPYLPHNCVNNCVMYIGTHDNDTLLGYYDSLSPAAKKYLNSYVGISRRSQLHDRMFRCLYSTVADTVILQMQDILEKDTSARMNYPSTIGSNWKWRMQKGEFTSAKIKYISSISKIYGRD